MTILTYRTSKFYMENNAANDLLGRTLETGWTVIEKIEKMPGQTGAFFSVCYKVEKNGEICFMKAYDFAPFFFISENSGIRRTIVDVLGDMLNAYRYERDLSEHCRKSHVTKVSFVKEAGEEKVNGYAIPIVPYLIFDMADGDVRKRLKYSENIDLSWKISSLHSIAVGIKQLHTIEVSHQDLKPSNILIFKNESKLGDIGRSVCKNIISPYAEYMYTGDIGYAPIEILYGQFERDWLKRSFATDCYMLGSMIVFYFSGVNMNALVRNNLEDAISWDYYSGSYIDIKDHVLNAFNNALIDFSNSIPNKELRFELVDLVKYLCNPDPDQRGHIKNLATPKNQYSMERFISRLDLLYKKAKATIITE